MPTNLKELAQHLMDELDWFGKQCSGQNPRNPEAGADWTISQHKAVLDVSFAREGMAAEPFIGYARVKNGPDEITFLFRRGYTPDWEPKRPEDTMYANYLSNVGPLVEMDPDETISIETVRLERIVQTYTVLATNKFSISRDGARYDAVKNRILISGNPPANIKSLAEYLKAITAGASTETLVTAKRGRNIIEHFALRDQPILDSVQGDVFRQPFSSQIILSGAPGTGKTTTLIKRIARNQRRDLLPEAERAKFENREDLFGPNNWALFLPSDLLKGYVQEAFAKQGIPASSERVRVWSSERIRIARDILGFAKIGSSGLFAPNSTETKISNTDCVKLFEEFEEFWPGHATKAIQATLDETPLNIGSRYSKELSAISAHLAEGKAMAAIGEIRRLRQELQEGRKQSQEDRERARKPNQQQRQPPPRIDEFFLSDDVRRATDRLDAASKNVLAAIPPAFAAFISTRRSQDKTLLAPHEFDVLIRTMLEAARHLLRVDAGIEDSILARIRNSFIPQVLIDEVADFSSNQIAALVALANPQTDSVTLCGDIMQRVTEHGITDWEECKKIVPTARHFKIELAYRQSPQLLKIASKILSDINSKEVALKSAYGAGDFPPALLKVTPNEDSVYKWITDRIVNIYEIHEGRLPAIAVLVPTENDVERVARGLARHLNPQSLEVQACRYGEVLGSESRVRVFNVQHIKGLEFEAVFFIDFDAIEKHYGALALNYLYVGLTRAATFLAITCASEPRVLSGVSGLFSRDDSTWKH